MQYIFDGLFLATENVPISRNNRALRYGDGLFETIRVRRGQILLLPYHLERLSEGMRLLQFEAGEDFIAGLERQITRLCEANHCLGGAKVSLQVFRGECDLFDHVPSKFHFLIQATPFAEDSSGFGDRGIKLGIFPHARISRDLYSNLKSSNYLPYLLAARYSSAQLWDDALLLNTEDRIVESAISNIFLVKNHWIYTPPLSEGCVAGVLRRHLLQMLPAWGLSVMEQPLSEADLEEADEIFLTNALRGIRPVGAFSTYRYHMSLAGQIHHWLEDSTS